MLQQLVIRNLAIIHALDLRLNTGMTVLTGETGAGKSILLDALGLILGDRADSTLIRTGTDKTEVTAVFSLADTPEVVKQLTDMDIETEQELYVRRVISRDGRSRAYLNNSPVPVQTLRELGESLIEIHGQHAHQGLIRSAIQRQLLDNYGNYSSTLTALNDKYSEWKTINDRLHSYNHVGKDYDARLKLLRYQTDELRECDPTENEFTELSTVHKRLSSAQSLIDACEQAIDALSTSEHSLINELNHIERKLATRTQVDIAFNNITALLDNARIQLEEAVIELRTQLGGIDDDSERLKEIEQRLDKLHELSRKHKVQPDLLSAHLDALNEELVGMEQDQDDFDQLLTKSAKLQEAYFSLANELSRHRCHTAKALSDAVTEQMQELGIAGKFYIEIETEENTTQPREYGNDRVSFLVSTNPGQPLKPITKIASGGELSRLSLAIQIIGSADSGVPTLIFDEVDSGISGGIAEITGKLLSRLAQHRQILCVTHLAQVAACGRHHLRVEKNTDNQEAQAQVIALTQEERIDEIARLLAGMEITHESRANAEKMLQLN